MDIIVGTVLKGKGTKANSSLSISTSVVVLVFVIMLHLCFRPLHHTLSSKSREEKKRGREKEGERAITCSRIALFSSDFFNASVITALR